MEHPIKMDAKQGYVPLFMETLWNTQFPHTRIVSDETMGQDHPTWETAAWRVMAYHFQGPGSKHWTVQNLASSGCVTHGLWQSP